MDHLTDTRGYIEALVVRPGTGAWTFRGGDGGVDDDDGQPDGKLALPLDRLVPLAEAPAAPAKAEDRDLWFVLKRHPGDLDPEGRGRTMRRLSLRTVLFAVIALFASLGRAGADIHPNTQSGFPVDQAFQVGDVDSINLFNGSLVLTIPIGLTYPVGGGMSYGLKLIYNSNPWFFQEIVFDTGSVTQSLPNPCSNAGLGWHLSFGSINSPCAAIADVGNSLFYDDPSGSQHILYPTLHSGEADDPATPPPTRKSCTRGTAAISDCGPSPATCGRSTSPTAPSTPLMRRGSSPRCAAGSPTPWALRQTGFGSATPRASG